MPYNGERASKGGHVDLVRNSDVAEFLKNSDYMKEPSEKEIESIKEGCFDAPESDELPIKVIASDASPYSEPINGLFPSTQIGYVKNSLVLIDVNDYNGLSSPSTRFVDPFKAADMHRNADGMAFILPGSNIKYKHSSTVSDGFRLAVWEQLSDDRTKMANSIDFNVASTLLAIEEENTIYIKKCPSCGEVSEDPFVFEDIITIHKCSACSENVYLTDSLRLHEQVSDFGDNGSAMTRFMNVIEQLNIATLIRMLFHYQPETLSKMAFFIDGPLAVFGQPAKVHVRLMKLYYDISAQLKLKGLSPPVIVGLQKTGMVAEHANSISRYLKNNTIRLIDDEYRGKWIKGSVERTENFGHETYFGQDFIFKTESGKIFTLGIPYPFAKKGKGKLFTKTKCEIDNYKDTLARTLAIIKLFELELYENAIVPIALAHRHASISLMPGGKVLDLVSKHGLTNNK
jgi:hypothetical protein